MSRIEEGRNFRNASEHPDKEKEVVFRDFGLKPGPKATLPSIEIKHPQTSQATIEPLPFMDRLIRQCGKVFEGFTALLCSENINLFDGRAGIFDCVLIERDKAAVRHGVRYAYQAFPKPGVAWPPQA